MAHDRRYLHDTAHGKNDDDAGRTKKCQDDGKSLSTGYRSNRLYVQLELDLWEHGISLPECCVHSNVEGNSPAKTLRVLAHL